MLFSGKEFAKLRGRYVRDRVLVVHDDRDHNDGGLRSGRRKACHTGEHDRYPGPHSDDDQSGLHKIPFKT
jgi:hypothetical protein